MSSKQRFFLVVEGQNDGYPNYSSAKIHFTEDDPCLMEYDNLFIVSPLFSVLEAGYNSIPELKDGTRITFIMVPNIFPSWNQIIKQFSPTNEIWFSLGLANLVVIENPQSNCNSKAVIEFLRTISNITAYESWIIKNSKIDIENAQNVNFEHKQIGVENFKVNVSELFPLHLKFAVSEYIISINKFLTASKKFTPHYYENHLKCIEASTEFIHDLGFLYGETSYMPTQGLLGSLKAKTVEEAISVLNDSSRKKNREDLINDRNGRLIQFNSSMSYVYSQQYAGTFPIFDHIGIIRRHSLLGIGSAIGSLFELVKQIEELLFRLPFERTDYNIYQHQIPSTQYFDFLSEPSAHNVDLWKNDNIRKTVLDNSMPKFTDQSLPKDYFNRLSFFSGRLGFREYDLSATAAIQVLVEGNSLQWHVINYTHEIIHNHVRLILHNIITPPLTIRNMTDEEYISIYSRLLRSAYTKRDFTAFTYKEYLTVILINFAIKSRSSGSLTKESSVLKVIKRHTENVDVKFKIPPAKELRESVLLVYKDISEIFVHVIDFSYIYKRNIDTYVRSIWASWSTVMSVTFDLKQYILRTLLVISVSENGTASARYDISKNKFLDLLDVIAKQNNNSYLFERIKILLNDSNEIDLKIRFYNCLIISDLVNNFYVGKLDEILDNDDANQLPMGTKDIFDNPISYNIDLNSFSGESIKSKVRFLLDQLSKSSSNQNKKYEEGELEKKSAWLLVCLSSINHL